MKNREYKVHLDYGSLGEGYKCNQLVLLFKDFMIALLSWLETGGGNMVSVGYSEGDSFYRIIMVNVQHRI